MKIAVSGTHGAGKSTLIAEFVARRPEYVYEPEAFETLGDDIAVSEGDEPTEDGLRALLEFTVSAVTRHPAPHVIFERSPIDYLAYAAASRRAWSSDAVSDFLETHIPTVRAAVRRLDLIVLIPIADSRHIAARGGENEGFRRRVDTELRKALIDDEYGLFAGTIPRVVELAGLPERWVSDLIRLTTVARGA